MSSLDPDDDYTPQPLTPRAKAIVTALLKPTDKEARVVLDRFQKAARWFPVGVNPFVRIGDILLAGVRSKLASQETPNPGAERLFPIDPVSATDSDVNEQDLKMFDRLMELVPSFDTILEELIVDVPQIFPFGKWMTEQGQGQRQVDSCDLKNQIFSYIGVPIIPGKKGTTRGFNDPLFARLLVPRKWLENFEREPQSLINRIKTKVIKLSSKDFPTFLYEESMEYDSNNIDYGLLRSQLLLKVYRHLFTGQGTALLGPAHISARPTKFQLYRRHGCDAHTIAYAAVQIYFTLSSAEEWHVNICGFDLSVLYNQIVRLFSNPHDPWVQETLAWWNHHVGIYHEPEYQNKSGSDTEPDDADDPIDEIEMQRERRRQQAMNNSSIRRNNGPIDPDLGCSRNDNDADGANDDHEPEMQPEQERHCQRQQSINNNSIQNDNGPIDPDLIRSRNNNGADGPTDSCDPPPTMPETSPLTDLDMNRASASIPQVPESGAGRVTRGKRQANSVQTNGKQNKKQKTTIPRVPSQRKSRKN